MAEVKSITVNSLQIGDRRVFETVFREHYKGLCYYALQYLKELSAAEEVVQDVFVKLWDKRQGLDIKDSVKAYLYRSVRNASLNYLKHQQVQQNYHQEQLLLTGQDADDVDYLESAELKETIEKAISQLPEERKKVFRMSRFEGLKYKEIADKLGISVKTVEAQMGKALKFLREELADFLPLLVWLLLEGLN